ncbi:glycosyltransferase [Serratia liquefaciens]|uniref:glycosyltransferase n=1 Tax=Serratia liquefaciens TaxID=614 RepID=UPI00217B5DCD|nr:glycosyltransferase [Serratia liquefaciens]CAI0813052.1 Hyaluronan synthase [Serratia liquefaciens]
MICFSQMNAFCNRLPHKVTPGDLANDKWVVENNLYGVDFYSSSSDILVFVGARFGLEVVAAYYNFKPREIIVIEEDEDKLTILRSLLNKNPEMKNRISVFTDIKSPEIIDKITGKVTSARVSLDSFSFNTLDYVLTHWHLDHICGEFNEYDTDAMDVYRLCAQYANSFYWHLYGKHKPLVGNRSQYEYEVSVVVPVYNISDYVDKCIGSLVNQTIGNLEILVVNDGTPDDSGEKADVWAAKYPGRVKVIHKPNGGCASARNAGMQQAKGQYIGFVDGDDWVEPYMYEELYRSAILSTSDIAQSGYQEVYETGEVIKFPLSVNLTRQDLLRERPTMWRRIYSSNMLRSKSITFPEHIRRFDDLPFQFETFFNAKSISNIPHCYYNYRQGRLGQDISVRDDRLYVHFPIFDWIYERNSELLNYEEEKKLFELEMDVHYWAYSVINKELKAEYLSKTAAQIFKAKRILSMVDMLKIAKSKGRDVFKFFIALWRKK